MNRSLLRLGWKGAAAGLLLFGASIAACAHTKDSAFERAIAKGARAETAGRSEEAYGEYERARKLAENKPERDYADELAVQLAQKVLPKSDAMKRLAEIAYAKPPHRFSAHALYQIGLARLEEGNDEQAQVTFEEVLTTFPETAFGKRALQQRLMSLDAIGPQEALTYLEAKEKVLATSVLIESIQYASAKRVEQLGRSAEARARYVAIAKRFPYPFGDTFDDSLVRASEIAERAGDFTGAIQHLEDLLSVREVSSMMGTYQRPLFTRAEWHRAELYRDKLNNPSKAREVFYELYMTFRTSSKRDDALFEIARIDKRTGRNPCYTWTRTLEEFPDSRYVPCVESVCKEKRLPRSRARPDCRHSLDGESPSSSVSP